MSKKISAADQILQQLREDIIDCRYAANDMLTEQEISQQFSVSKTPAREALNYLCVEGLLEKIPHKGYLVREISLQQTKNLLQFRYILESAIIELAVQNATEEELRELKRLADYRLACEAENVYKEYRVNNLKFHIRLAELTRNPYLTAALRGVLTLLERSLVLDGQRSNFNDLLAFHSGLTELIAKRDAAAALELNRKMNDESRRRLLFDPAFLG